jgi:hypothetical protein
MKRYLVVWFVLAASVLSLFATFSKGMGDGRNPGITWQSSTSSVVQLGIRDKNAVLGDYKATFKVTAPDGKLYTKEIAVKGDSFEYVLFPTDFDSYMQSGNYTWVCLVAGKTVLKGKFSHNFGSKGEENLSIEETQFPKAGQ